MLTTHEKAQDFLNGFKGENGIRSNPFSDQLELNLLVGISELLKDQELEVRSQVTADCAASLGACGRDASGQLIWLEEAKETLQALAEEALALEAESLDQKMKQAGMIPFTEMLKGSLMNGFIKHNGVNSLETFEEWLEMRNEEFLKQFCKKELNGRNEDNDDMYEWVLAHRAVFNEVHVNFLAAMKSCPE